MPNPIRLSYSTLELLHTCERKFQLIKLLQNDLEREENEHFVFGKAFGTGVAHYLVYQNRDAALYQAWLSYFPILEYNKKTQESALLLLIASFDRLDDLLLEYEVLSFNGKPATELSFRLDIDENYYFVGYIDVVLRHRFTGVNYILEVKHTGFELLDLSGLYQNSGQALGYSIVLDRIVGAPQAEYGVIYFVGQMKRTLYDFVIHIIPFQKTLLDRLNWFISLGMDVAHLEEMARYNVYPKRGSSCISFMKPCSFLGVCGLHSLDRKKISEEDLTTYQFTYQLQELIEDHLRRL